MGLELLDQEEEHIFCEIAFWRSFARAAIGQ